MSSIIKPPNPKKVQDLSLVMPELLFVNKKGPYHYGYRKVSSWLIDFKAHTLKDLIDPNKSTVSLISRYRRGLPGTDVWICLDLSNGNPELYLGRVYLWIYKSKDKANERYQIHRANKGFSKLSPPVRCLIVDSFTIM